MKRVSSITPELLHQRIEAAKTAWLRKDFLEAIQLLEQASRLAPADIGILLMLGLYYGLRYDPAAAERCFEKALRLAPNKAQALSAIAAHCQSFRHYRLYERYLKLAVEAAGTMPMVFVKLAELYERQHHLPEASEMIDRALHGHPRFPPALLVRARLERLAGRLESAGEILSALVNQPIALAWVHAQCWYELGTVLDRQGRYDEAMNAVLQAKALLFGPSPFGISAELLEIRKQIQTTESYLSPEVIQRWLANAPNFEPTQRLALLCGYARSGTTLLEQVLDAHPGIISLEETSLFLDDALTPVQRQLRSIRSLPAFLDAATVPLLAKSRSSYAQAVNAFLGEPAAQRLVLDKNPTYTCLLPAFIRIFPETKFLVAIRDPRDVVISRFMQTLEPGPFNSTYASLGGTVDDYASLMHFWLALKPMLTGHFLEVRYEDMVEDLEPVARQTLEFLGVPWDKRVLGFDAHARRKVVHSPTYADVTQPVYKRARGRWQHYQKYLEPHLPKLEPFVKAFGY